MIYKLIDRDELVLHKLGLLLGTIVGVLFGMFISEKANVYQEIEDADKE